MLLESRKGKKLFLDFLVFYNFFKMVLFILFCFWVFLLFWNIQINLSFCKLFGGSFQWANQES